MNYTKGYIKKCQDLLNDSKTYTKLKKDPSAKYKNELISVLKEMKKRGVISVQLHKKRYSTCDQPPRFYGLPKLHKQNMPFRPIVSSIGSSTYECAKYLTKILSLLLRKNAHHVNKSKDFASEIKGLQVENDEEFRSFDVTALFTSVKVDEAPVVIRDRLSIDTTLSDRTSLTTDDIIMLLWRLLSTDPWSGDGVPSVSYCLQLVYGRLRGKGVGDRTSSTAYLETLR